MEKTKTSTASSKKTVGNKEAKKTIKAIKEEAATEAVESKVEFKEEPKLEKEKKTYRDDDLIVCRSVTRGYLSYIGKKSGERYVFANYDDTCEIEVRDLNALRASKSQYLFDPLFVIEDYDFICQPKWESIKEMYDRTMDEDIDQIINLPLNDFKAVVPNLPKGYQEALCVEIATRINNNDFDSLKKIETVDELFGTDLKCMIV